MPRGWEEYSLGDLIEIKHGFAFSGEYFKDDPQGDILLTPGNFSIGGGFKDDKFKYYVGPVTQEFVLDERDLLITMTDLSKKADTLGYPAIIPKPSCGRFLHNQRLGKVLIKNGASLNKGFLYYLLKTNDYRHEVLASATGTTVKHTSPNRILAFKFKLPPPYEQQAIAHILGTLDDKIELNRRMNETLEAMARAIFKSWFVDFDPVRVKAEGRKPDGMDTDSAALFPDSFEDSPMGKIPKGWKMSSFDQLIEIWSGGTPQTSIDAYWNGDIPWFTVTDAPSEDDIFVIDTGKYITQAGVDKSATRLLPVGTTIISARGTVGKLAMVGRPMAMNQTCYGLKGKEGYPDPFIYFQTKALVEELKQRTHGCVFDTIIRDTFKMLEVASPPPNIAEAFGAKVEPILQKIYGNLLESRTLATIRDTLLPKLLSGEVRVKDVEKIVEAKA